MQRLAETPHRFSTASELEASAAADAQSSELTGHLGACDLDAPQWRAGKRDC